MADRVAKDALYEGFAEVARALASGRRTEIADLLAQGERPVDVAGARSVPVTGLRRRPRALPPGADVVACCRGPYYMYADEGVRELTRQGFRARPLTDGYPEWNRAGLPIAAGEGG